ncbi:MAG: SRPBCC domain-containing protein [Ignavibacteriaceae bacterium]|nr:SRPBCC domain-containing protein [Ignavibacteriaceae bacterium]
MKEKELVLERTYDASPRTVWQDWTKPEMIKQWWGPNNVIIPECEVDPRVGGKIYIVMEADAGMGPYKGTKWPMLGKFTVVEPNSKLSYDAKAWTEGQKEETTIEQTTELSLTEEKGKTKIKIRAVIHKAGPGARMAVEGMQYGFTQQLDKLNNFLTAKK